MANIIFQDGTGSIRTPVLTILQPTVHKAFFAKMSSEDVDTEGNSTGTQEPSTDTLKKEWMAGLKPVITAKSKLSLLVDVHSEHTTEGFSSKYVDYKGYTGEGDDGIIPNEFLNEDGEWFEVSRKLPVIVIDPGHGFTGNTVNVGAQARKYRYKLQNTDGSAQQNADGVFATNDAWAGDLPQYVLDDQEEWITKAILTKYDSTKLEAHLTYDIATNLINALKEEGYEVFNTRSSRTLVDVTNSQLDERVKVARDHKADYFISIHADGSTDFLESGAHCIYPKDKYGNFSTHSDSKRSSKELAKDIFSSYSFVSIESDSPKEDTRGLYVLNPNKIKVKRRILVELGYISNPKECMAMFNNIESIANELFIGIKRNIDNKF